jgi:hypothetical protein
MNFDNIKNKMDAENLSDAQIPTRIKDLKDSQMPIQKVRKTMRGEIITQLICIIVFFAAPSFVKMHQLPEALYYILMFVTSLMTLGYLAKMTWFLNKTSHMNEASKDTIVTFIHDLRLTLEVYKTAIIAGSLLLPLSMLILFLGFGKLNEEKFTELIMLDMSATMLIISAILYIVLAIFIYFVTVAWANNLYGVHIKKLEKILKEFE